MVQPTVNTQTKGAFRLTIDNISLIFIVANKITGHSGEGNFLKALISK